MTFPLWTKTTEKLKKEKRTINSANFCGGHIRSLSEDPLGGLDDE
jgi:hypothetical protein